MKIVILEKSVRSKHHIQVERLWWETRQLYSRSQTLKDFIASESQQYEPYLFKHYSFSITIGGGYNIVLKSQAIHEYLKISLELIYIFSPL